MAETTSSVEQKWTKMDWCTHAAKERSTKLGHRFFVEMLRCKVNFLVLQVENIAYLTVCITCFTFAFAKV